MSIYNPPSRTQDIFNPSNYGGLGAGGEITIDYLKSSFFEFPVTQGNTTLVGTSVLGDITQQGDFSTTGDLLVNDVNIITELGNKQDEIADGDLTISKTEGLQTALDNKYDDTGGTINGNVSITGGLLVGTTNIITELGNKQDTIEDGDLTIEKTSGLQSALDNKYDDTGGTIDGNVDITGNLVVGTTNIIIELGNKQDTIEDGDLTIAKTSGLQTAIDDKQEIINEDTYLSCKRVSANQLVAFQTQEFDTIVLRRPTGYSGRSNDFIINFQELQCWVNDVNILASNAVDLVSLYALWTDKGVDIGAERPSSGAYNNEFSYTFGSVVYEYATHSPISYRNDDQVVLIIKQIPPTEINAIQSLVLYNRTDDPAYNVRTEGLAIELYNETNDPTFSNNLISTNVIASSSDVYRFDFKSIDSYISGFVGSPQSTTNIPNDTYALKEITDAYENTDGNVSCDTINSTGNVDIGGNLVVGTTNIITELGNKQNTIEDGDLTIAKTNGLQSALDDKYDKTGGLISGGVQISGQLAPNGNIFTDERLVIQSGDTMELADETEVKISSGVIDVVVDGADESISLNGYTYLNGTLELLVDEGTILNNVGGGIEIINYFNYNKLKEDVAGKQDTITPSTDLSCNSLNTNQLIVNDDLYFDTIVIRRPTNIGTGKFEGIREVQLFVNDVNVLPNLVPQSTFKVDGTPLQDIYNIPFFIDWSDKTLDPNYLDFFASEVVDEIIGIGTLDYSAYWGILDNGDKVTNTDVGLYIPMSDKINIKDIQSAIIYNRDNGNSNFVGCAIELYNRSNDPNLEYILSSTNLITTAEDVYRFDFPAIDTYGGVFSDTNSITQIASETLALKEVVSEFAESANITGGLKVDTITTTGNVDITGDLVVNDINVITEIGTKQDEITTSTDLTCNTLTAVGDIKTTG